MLTADTVTDEQIRDLLERLRKSGAYGCNKCGHTQASAAWCDHCGWGDIYFTNRTDMRACYAALSTSEIGVSSWTKETARARVAEILNKPGDS
jgi:lipopolysaccharide biosynthesis regulator YciM